MKSHNIDGVYYGGDFKTDKSNWLKMLTGLYQSDYSGTVKDNFGVKIGGFSFFGFETSFNILVISVGTFSLMLSHNEYMTIGLYNHFISSHEKLPLSFAVFFNIIFLLYLFLFVCQTWWKWPSPTSALSWPTSLPSTTPLLETRRFSSFFFSSLFSTFQKF